MYSFSPCVLLYVAVLDLIFHNAHLYGFLLRVLLSYVIVVHIRLFILHISVTFHHVHYHIAVAHLILPHFTHLCGFSPCVLGHCSITCYTSVWLFILLFYIYYMHIICIIHYHIVHIFAAFHHVYNHMKLQLYTSVWFFTMRIIKQRFYHFCVTLSTCQLFF